VVISISIHASLAGSDIIETNPETKEKYFNPRFPCGKRLRVWDKRQNKYIISIHASLAGSDQLGKVSFYFLGVFQSTLPLREATKKQLEELNKKEISIHASLAGSDCIPKDVLMSEIYFNPRFPCGKRHFLKYFFI